MEEHEIENGVAFEPLARIPFFSVRSAPWHKLFQEDQAFSLFLGI
jgi:hypothetical protein